MVRSEFWQFVCWKWLASDSFDDNAHGGLLACYLCSHKVSSTQSHVFLADPWQRPSVIMTQSPRRPPRYSRCCTTPALMFLSVFSHWITPKLRVFLDVLADELERVIRGEKFPLFCCRNLARILCCVHMWQQRESVFTGMSLLDLQSPNSISFQSILWGILKSLF